jgi:hypothetical protein
MLLHSVLRRYTDLPATLSILRSRTITLLDPASWDDSNDRYFLEQYKSKRGLTSVLALCFTQAAETYHHWRVFSSGSSGICVVFRRTALLDAVGTKTGVSCRDLSYVKINSLKKARLSQLDLPYTKRIPFADEQEFRIIFESWDQAVKAKSYRIPLSCIERVVVSPWLNSALYADVKHTLTAIKGCSKLVVTRSTLVGNDRWKKLGAAAR